MTSGVRVELAGKRILVQGVHLGAADTDMMAGRDGPKIDPVQVRARSTAIRVRTPARLVVPLRVAPSVTNHQR